jgi:hypothetical protein
LKRASIASPGQNVLKFLEVILRYIIACAGCVGGVSHVVADADRDHNDFGGRVSCFNLASRLEPVRLLHADVHQHPVRLVFPVSGKGLGPVVTLVHFVDKIVDDVSDYPSYIDLFDHGGSMGQNAVEVNKQMYTFYLWESTHFCSERSFVAGGKSLRQNKRTTLIRLGLCRPVEGEGGWVA